MGLKGMKGGRILMTKKVPWIKWVNSFDCLDQDYDFRYHLQEKLFSYL
jgi:hypothetical protein